MRASGLDVEGRIGDGNPISAVQDVWDPREFGADGYSAQESTGLPQTAAWAKLGTWSTAKERRR